MSKASILLGFPFASVMAVNALMVVVLILVVVTVFGIAVIYNRRKRKASVCGIQNLGVLVFTSS